MTWSLLIALAASYGVILVWMYRKDWQLRTFVWGALGLAYIILQFSLLINLPHTLAALEAQHMQALASLVHIHIQIFETTTMLVPDGAGWVSMTIGIESSTIIEMAVFSGLMLFYPRITFRRRVISLGAGLLLTYVLNLLRLAIIVLIVVLFGRSAFVIAHALVGRIIYFIGVLLLYWYLLTKPTLYRVQQSVRERER